MAKELDKQELVRLAWTTELRRQGHRQCVGGYKIRGNVCALGLLLEMAVDPHDFANPKWDMTDTVGALAGLSGQQAALVAHLNDGTFVRKHTFSEIADVVDGWFSK